MLNATRRLICAVAYTCGETAPTEEDSMRFHATPDAHNTQKPGKSQDPGLSPFQRTHVNLRSSSLLRLLGQSQNSLIPIGTSVNLPSAMKANRMRSASLVPTSSPS